MDLLNFENNNATTGFRLKRLEIMNWGTFNNICRIEPDGYNSLITGNIGSGKSTVVDAVTTLLVPHNKIIYNKAAGAERRERTLYSYIRGEYRTEKSEEFGGSKSVYLRDEKSYSVILGHFYNSGYLEDFVLAQVFWLRNNSVEKFFITSEKNLTVLDNFTDFGTDIKDLKKKLRNTDGVEVFDNFSVYSSRFRSVFGIKSEKALDLFYHTVSLKQIGNLTEFVRENMLEKEDISDEISTLLKNFDSLNRAHDSVEKAREQIRILEPLITLIEEYDAIGIKVVNNKINADALPIHFNLKKLNLYKKTLEQIVLLKSINNNRLNDNSITLQRLDSEKTIIIKAIANDKQSKLLGEIEYQIKVNTEKKIDRQKKFEHYKKVTDKLGLKSELNEDVFYRNIQLSDSLKSQIEESINAVNEESINTEINIRDCKNKIDIYENELKYMLTLRHQIPLDNFNLRSLIVNKLDINENEIPFAAELIKVKEDCEDWEPAIERVLRSFGLSILVSSSYYERINSFVNKTDLKGRVVYYKIDENKTLKINHDINPQSLINKISIKEDTVFYNWLHNEILNRFGLICCENEDEFKRYPFALTKNGLVKRSGIRHEKDDRNNIFDRSNFIFGWDNKKKVTAYRSKIDELKNRLSVLQNSADKLTSEKQEYEEKQRQLFYLNDYQNFDDINWVKYAKELENQINEKKLIEDSSDQLKTLNFKLQSLENELLTINKEREVVIGDISNLNKDAADCNKRISELENFFNLIEVEQVKQVEEKTAEYFNKYFEKHLSKGDYDQDLLNNLELNLREKLNKERDSLYLQNSGMTGKISRMMADFNNKFADDTMLLTADISYMDDYREIFKKLKKDDLPKFERKFKDLLKEKTIQGIALFKQKLDSFTTEIFDKINQINKSLKEIEYNQGTYILLETDEMHDIDIKEFKVELRRCLENTAGESDVYSEEKFLQVKKILNKLSDEKYHSWMIKVTDVRNWYRFNARERWLSDNSEKEFYSDSSGKSGGQKEKLAYTILASALAYQFGLEWNETRSRSFRFAVIDEAFSRGSDDSVRYGLELFDKLDLQLLVITPLQKINVLENYVRSIHPVTNNSEGSNSLIKKISIDEHIREKQGRQK